VRVRTKHHRALSLALTAATTLAFMIAINIGVQLGVQALTREIGDAARKGSDPPARTSPAAPRTGRPVAKPTA
jgi:predicted RND superfamily exporter protein